MNCYEIVTKGKTVSRRHKSIFSTLALFLALCNVGVAEEKNAEKKPLDTIEKSSSVTVDSNVEGKKQQPVTLKNVVLAQFLAWYKVGEGGATAEESDYLDLMEPTPENTPTYSGTCEDLHPIKDLDDLLFQIYSHLDDDCLYAMPMAELSKKWGVKIISFTNDDGEWVYKDHQAFFDDFDKLLQSLSSTDIQSRMFLRKGGSATKNLADISLAEQRKYRDIVYENKNVFRNRTSYEVIFTDSYLEQLGFPLENRFFKEIRPSRYYHPGMNPHADLGHPFKKCSQFKRHFRKGSYKWNGYTSSFMDIQICGDGSRWFVIYFDKTIYKNKVDKKTN